MAANHTPEMALCEEKAIEYFWKHCKFPGANLKSLRVMAKMGALSMSRILELCILENSRLQQSNLKGEDFKDGSDAKFATARNKVHWNGGRNSSGEKYISERNWADVGGLKNKKGILRIFINYFNSQTKVYKPYMFVIPYKVWSKHITSSGCLKFYFSSKEDGITKITKARFGEYQVFSIKDLGK